MFTNHYFSFARLALFSVVLFVIHYFVFEWLEIDLSTFHYSLGFLYFLFFGLSLLVLIALLLVKKKSYEQVGMSFLLLTSCKMLVAYVILRPILAKNDENVALEKMSFFMIFILYLIIDTYITIRILNEKQQN
ncbi:hypothetical protein [Flavobacterium sp. UMI-01]|uniref:hypothetical protein n=1 Tax=Flavobacterium sp. UMI-01 TaxID=1441053 RepID=UPI001C7D0D8A|nr:hypothetical protein [Flavobacterium sp. UMI-01]GIZ08027.1 hypothetical protein FUMI01_07540 [Flavobacterium sp. UMI-01]